MMNKWFIYSTFANKVIKSITQKHIKNEQLFFVVACVQYKIIKGQTGYSTKVLYIPVIDMDEKKTHLIGTWT